ncbi:amidase domain-containing protein [Paenibacillus tuaregi]|uniref:amidase domain-containing protein n=1 Tax=Paenibacillus tuaregi TaxID=1816681 RepID=UPI000837F45A|nr:amidase domain-containing protein [Paenibacillus tuaregi]
MYRILKSLLIFAIVTCHTYGISSLPAARAESSEKEQITLMLQNLFENRAKLLLDQNKELIKDYYLPSDRYSRHAFQHELDRAEYLQTWAHHRRMKFVNAECSIRIIRLNVTGDTAKVSLAQSLKVSYEYKGKYPGQHDFGIGTRHAIRLKKVNQSWLLEREWYSDPLEENPKLIQQCDTDFIPGKAPVSVRAHTKYNRLRAVEYANKYAGLAWGAGNEHRYNRKYLDYTSKGGDCTNFSSQVIGDKEEGGGLRMWRDWRYFYGNGGSQAWVRTDSFKSFLVHSGYGTVVAHGDFTKIVKFSNKLQQQGTEVYKFQPGDLIAYQLNGDIDHFSVIVGFDQGGYPLVNSHTADRYRVPFDLGWDKYTKYQVIHIRD